MMMSYGMFVFSLSTAAYQELQRRTAWRHAQNQRVGARPANQFLGPGEETITLQGLIAPPITGDRKSLDTLRQLGDQGAPLALVDGNGKAYGAWVMDNLEEQQSIFFQDGTARRIEFTLALRCTDSPAQAQAQTSSATTATTSTTATASTTSTTSTTSSDSSSATTTAAADDDASDTAGADE